MDAPAFNAHVILREDPTPELATVRVAPDGWELPDFEPGQFATLGLVDPRNADGPLLRRVYSIASAPGQEHLEFYLRLVPAGRFTSVLWPSQVGDPVWLNPKILGTFTLQHVPPQAELIMVATGTGIAPFLSMLRHYRGQGRWRSFALVHGARIAGELGYAAELRQMAAEDPGFRYLPVLSREPGWNGRQGRVQAVLDELALDPARTHVFLCGNPDMIDDVEARLGARGFTAGKEGNLHFERYW